MRPGRELLLLVEDIYKAADGERHWAPVLRSLQWRLKCVACAIVVHDFATGRGAIELAVGIAAPLGPGGSAGIGVAVLVASVAAIWLRGYVVPGTPWLTRTYFPDRVLRYFDHHEAGNPTESPDGTVDPEAILLAAGALTECDDRDDLCLTPAFRAAWHERIDALRGTDASRGDLAEMLGLPVSALEFEDYGSAFQARAAADHLGGPESERWRVGQWESEGAFIADMAAAGVLDGRLDGWDAFSAPQRGQVLNGLRVFLDTCPTCGGPVAFGEETVESCCMSVDVVAVTCEACDDRLFEARQPFG
jgi:hypothetical protein